MAAARKAPAKKAPAPRLAPEDWTRAALQALASGGIANVSVERLAAELGATKGSFYWHFKDRPALIAATLERWEHEYTDVIIERLSLVDDPRERFRRLLETSFGRPGALVDALLIADSDDPVVAEVLASVSAKRLAFVDQIFAQHGSEGGSDRALLAFSAYLGLTQLARTAPKLTPRGARATAYVDNTVRFLMDD
jgi:AcrR family transcriptional regulator